MRISDWSSDVCSSDLLCRLAAPERVRQPLLRTGADRAPHPHGEAAVIRPALLAALITAFPAAAQPTSPTREPKQGHWWYQAPPPVEDPDAAPDPLMKPAKPPLAAPATRAPPKLPQHTEPPPPQ